MSSAIFQVPIFWVYTSIISTRKNNSNTLYYGAQILSCVEPLPVGDLEPSGCVLQMYVGDTMLNHKWRYCVHCIVVLYNCTWVDFTSAAFIVVPWQYLETLLHVNTYFGREIAVTACPCPNLVIKNNVKNSRSIATFCEIFVFCTKIKSI